MVVESNEILDAAYCSCSSAASSTWSVAVTSVCCSSASPADGATAAAECSLVACYKDKQQNRLWTSEFNVIYSPVQGLGRAYRGTEVRLLLAQGSNFDRMPFLPPPMTHMDTSGIWTQVLWGQVNRLNHCTTTAPSKWASNTDNILITGSEQEMCRVSERVVLNVLINI